MIGNKISPANIDEYINQFPVEIRPTLKKLREVIKKAAPQAGEAIKYGIPTFTLNGNLVHFGAFKSHIGFFPTPSAINAFKKELTSYKISKGTIQFPLEKRTPFPLIREIVKFRVAENLDKQLNNKGKNKIRGKIVNGHRHEISRGSRTNPVWAKQKIADSDFLSMLSSPARRALENAGIKSLKELSKLRESELLKLHGMGPFSIKIISDLLSKSGLHFKK